QGAEFVADAAAGLEGQARLVDLLQDAVHRVGDGARHGAVDGAGGRLVRQGAGVGGDAAGGDRPAAQRPQEALVPVLLLLGARLGPGQGPGHALVGAVDVGIHGFAGLGLEAVLLVPDVLRSRLHRDVLGGWVLHGLEAHAAHVAWISFLSWPGSSRCLLFLWFWPRIRGFRMQRRRCRAAGTRRAGFQWFLPADPAPIAHHPPWRRVHMKTQTTPNAWVLPSRSDRKSTR